MIEHRRGYLTAENLPATVRRFKRENEPMTFNVGTSLAELQREATLGKWLEMATDIRFGTI